MIQFVVSAQQQSMQKFRKWTDQSTGINPFICPKKSQRFFSVYNIPVIILILIKLVLFALILQPFMLLFLIMVALHEHILRDKLNLHFMSGFIKFGWHIVAIIGFGIWGTDDQAFLRNLEKKDSRNNKKGILLLSNNNSILNPLYYMARVNDAKFLVSSSSQESFYTLSGIQLIIKLIFNRQPFFTIDNKGAKLKTILDNQLGQGNNCILFYEGIRTNGLGTIKISTKLSNQLFSLEYNYHIVHIKSAATTEKDSLHSVVNHPLRILIECMGSLQTKLKVRSRIQSISSMSSGAEVQKQIDTFLTANATKLLDTHPSDYFEFIAYYQKSQKEGYTQQ